jgi:hypothetical protein
MNVPVPTVLETPASNDQQRATTASGVTAQDTGQTSARQTLTLMVTRSSLVAPLLGLNHRIVMEVNRSPPRLGRGIKIPKTTLSPENCVTSQSGSPPKA